MNKQYNVEKRLKHYDTLIQNYLVTDELPTFETEDSLEQYLYRVLTSPFIQEKLEDDNLQQIFKQQMLHFFRYMLMQAQMSENDLSEKTFRDFEKYLTNEIKRTDHFLISRQAQAEDFKEMLELMQGQRWTEQDYIIVNDIKNTYRNYPVLAEIIQIMGRTIGDGTECVPMKENGVGKSHRALHSDIIGIETGNDIASALPTELVFLTSPLLEIIFLNKWAEQQLQVFQHRSMIPAKATRKGTKERASRGGAMIACIDTSGSMFGNKEQIAKGMVLELFKTAKRQKRPLFLITFSIHIRCIDATGLPENKLYNDFLRTTFSGGTSCLAALEKALKVLQTERFAWADVLLISDFEFNKCTAKIRNDIAEMQQHGVAFYGLQLGKGYNMLHNIFNKIWQL